MGHCVGVIYPHCIGTGTGEGYQSPWVTVWGSYIPLYWRGIPESMGHCVGVIYPTVLAQVLVRDTRVHGSLCGGHISHCIGTGTAEGYQNPWVTIRSQVLNEKLKKLGEEDLEDITKGVCV